ncbi:MAG: transcriptional regulator, partial [Phycisphaerales bacterium]|nr:transcriptional regulator [Phycisphaerales bacterium]
RRTGGGPGGSPPAVTLLPPRGLVTRRSTDVLATDDREVAAAVRYIREWACGGPPTGGGPAGGDGVEVDAVAAHVAVSRSVLQRRFRAAVGHTLHEEVTRVRLARAQELLAGTDLPIAAVAAKAGFTHQEYLGAVFRRRLGVTPARYRRDAKR